MFIKTTDFEKRIIKEVSNCNSISYLNYRIDYISKALMYHNLFGMRGYKNKYSSLKATSSELVFYLEELRKRLDYLKRLQELDEEKYRKRGLI